MGGGPRNSVEVASADVVEVLALLVGLYDLVAPAMGIVAYLALRKSRGAVRQLRAELGLAPNKRTAT